MNTRLADRLDAAGLTGRGGAAFSTGVKVRAALTEGAGLIVNACDGEYGAVKDRYVVTHHLEELVGGASLIAGRRARYAAKRGGDAESALLAAGLDVLSVPDRYVSSEESALVSLAHGGLARPLTKAVPVVFGSTTARGRRLPPTVVLNAETVWRVAQIDDRGVDWFRSFGTADEPGPRLASVSGAVTAPGVVGTEAGVAVGTLVEAAGGAHGPLGAVGVGGLSGGWLDGERAAEVTWSRAGLHAYGFSPGPGTVHVLAADECPITHVAAVLRAAAGESAGQCGPCLFGVPAVADDVSSLASGRLDPAGWHRLQGRLGLLPGRGACRFPDGVSGYARSALRTFGAEVAAHRAGSCAAEPRRHRGGDRHAVAV